jgi:hypothetical protein
MAPAGLSAVLRSRRTSSIASHGNVSAAALRGTCSYPWRTGTTSMRHSRFTFGGGSIHSKDILAKVLKG